MTDDLTPPKVRVRDGKHDAEIIEKGGELSVLGAKRAARRAYKDRTAITEGKLTGDQWEYISLRVQGLSARSAVIKVAQDNGERLTQMQAKKRAQEWESLTRGRIEKAQRERFMTDAEFEAWARLKTEQLVSDPGPYTQGVLRSIMYLKKMREENRASTPEALAGVIHSAARQMEKLDELEAEARRMGLGDGDMEANKNDVPCGEGVNAST